MDPLGLAKDIFRLVGIVYWGLALVLVCVALIKPRNKVVKFAGAGAVIAVFASPLFFAGNDVRRINAAFKDSCSQVRSSIDPVASGSSQFVDMEMVYLLRKSPPYATEFIRYMLERRLSVLELTYDPQYWTDLRTKEALAQAPKAKGTKSGEEAKPWGIQPGVFVRLSLREAGHPTCRGFDRWSEDYPAQHWPSMQKLGLRIDQCIGFELVDQLQSRHGMFVEKTILERNGNNGALELHKYRLQDLQSGQDLGQAVLTISSVFEHRDVLCNSEEIAQKLLRAIQSAPDPRYAQFIEVDVPGKPFPAAKRLSMDELRARRLRFKERTISEDRLVWSESKHEVKPDGSVSTSEFHYELVSLWNGAAYRIPLRSGHVPPRQETSAVGASEHGIAALMRSGYGPTDGGVFVEFTRDGQPLREQLLSAEEMRELGLR